MNLLKELEKFGQSFWLDNISRDIIKNGKLKELIDKDGLKGVTSNPTIFQKAISGGRDYDEQIRKILEENPSLTSEELFEKLSVKDIQDAADVLRTVYDATSGQDGFVSLEVSPKLAYDTDRTIDEARRLFNLVKRPNVMIKIPATNEGIPAIKKMISEGVNINITLIFSPKVYEEVVEAYLSGLVERLNNNQTIDKISSVASFFISRIDTLVDQKLNEAGNKELRGKVAIANAKLVYQRALDLFDSERFKKLQDNGAKIQRLLWASTSTKNPDYPDVYYINELIGRNTINTIPPDTINAFRDHGAVKETLTKNVGQAEEIMNKLPDLKIDFDKVTQQLTKEGVAKFEKSFDELTRAIETKKEELVNEVS